MLTKYNLTKGDIINQWHPRKQIFIPTKITTYQMLESMVDYEVERIKLTKNFLELNNFKKDGYTNISPDYSLINSDFYINIKLNGCVDNQPFITVYNRKTKYSIIAQDESLKHEFYIDELQHMIRECGFVDFANNLKYDNI